MKSMYSSWNVIKFARLCLFGPKEKYRKCIILPGFWFNSCLCPNLYFMLSSWMTKSLSQTPASKDSLIHVYHSHYLNARFRWILGALFGMLWCVKGCVHWPDSIFLVGIALVRWSYFTFFLKVITLTCNFPHCKRKRINLFFYP